MTGLWLAARHYPGGFDWAYTVLSALASKKHNPRGAVYFAAGLALSLVILWPALTWIGHGGGRVGRLQAFGSCALRVGVVFGVLVGLERLTFFHISQRVRKAHEVLAIVCFLGLYSGVLALHLDRSRRHVASIRPTILAISPLIAIGLSQAALYFDQRDLGWVGPDWREMGVPVWLSFAFWQWLAVAALWVSIGHLLLTARSSTPKETS